MEEGDDNQETSVRGGKGKASTSHSHANTSIAASTSTVKKTPAGRKPQQKKREGAELKAPPSKRRQGTAVSATAGATPAAGSSSVTSGGGEATPSLAVLQMRKKSRGYNMFQSVLSGKSALKVNKYMCYSCSIHMEFGD